jgi:DNA-binding GntR family transcriptional regulator
LNVVSKNVSDEKLVKNGERVLEGLKTVFEEIKKKQNLLKNKEDSKKVFDELCRKYLSSMYWEDLERPFHKMIMEPSDNAYFNYILKKGMAKAQQATSSA